MNTGDRCPFWNGPTVKDYMASRRGPKEMEEWCYKNSAYYYNAIQGARRAPSSYSHLNYYTQMAYEMKGGKGASHLVKFRLVSSGRKENGLPDGDDQKAPWKFTARSGDSRSADYLKQEYKERLEDGSAMYHLQIQVHSASSQEDLEIFNMGKAWDEKRSPWHDLAEVTIFRHLGDSVTERTCYNVGNLPDCLFIPEPPSYQDYRSIGYLRCAIYQTSQRARLWSGPPKDEHAVKIRYSVTFQTADTGEAGYDGEVRVTITGSKGRTEPLLLDKSRIFRNDFGRGEEDVFHFDAADVGDLWTIQFDLGDRTDGWYIEMVKIEKERQVFSFPAYQWIFGGTTVRRGEAKLPFQDNDEMRALRALETQKWRNRLPWKIWKDKGFPSCPAIEEHTDLPRDLQFRDERERDMNVRRREGIGNFLLNRFFGIFDDIDSFHSFTEFFRYKLGEGEVPAVAHRWQWDSEFGRQFLQGTHPTIIRRVEKLPENFPVTDEAVKAILGRKVSLEEEIEAGHVYIADYKILEGVKAAEGRYVTPAMGLFYVNAADSFVPLAIQLHQKPGPDNPIWTAEDSYADWLCAKFFLKCADAQVHQMRDHLLLTHLIMEPIAVALFRNVPSVHPVFKLLIPHVRYTVAINTIGRKALIGTGGLADQGLSVGKGGHLVLVSKGYKEFDFEALKLPVSLAQRGVINSTELPNYPYRDDALKLWDAIKQFVEDVVRIYYKSDEDVTRDEEIQDWISEVHNIGLPQHGLDGEMDHHVPHEFKSIADLVDVLTVIIFTCSCEHAAQNFGQFDFYGFYPNYPMIMRQPPPRERGKLRVDQLPKMLGHADYVCVQMAGTWLLSEFSSDEVFLGKYPQQHFQERETLQAIDQFYDRLTVIEGIINERNRNLAVPYEYLKPSRVPNSIAV